MIQFKYGNIWDSKANAVCVTTNGIIKRNGHAVMGAGIAKQAKILYPHLPVLLGQSLKLYGNRVFKFPFNKLSIDYIITLPTKHDWRDKSELSLVNKSIKELVELVEKFGLSSIALPVPGAGLGGLKKQYVINNCLIPKLDERFQVWDFKKV